jgi:hypothetical protein
MPQVRQDVYLQQARLLLQIGHDSVEKNGITSRRNGNLTELYAIYAYLDNIIRSEMGATGIQQFKRLYLGE